MSKKIVTVDTGVLFYPRGGSAGVVSYVSKELMSQGLNVRLLVGSLGYPGEPSHAKTFYEGIEVREFDYNEAQLEFAADRNSMADTVASPFHPSFEDRGISPDTIFSGVSPQKAAHLTKAWVKHFQANRSKAVDVVHLHHLSHLQEAAAVAYPGVPIVTTLHGTELKLIEGMRERVALLNKVGVTSEEAARVLSSDGSSRTEAIEKIVSTYILTADELKLLHDTRWEIWEYAPFWLSKFKEYVELAGTILTVSEHDSQKAAELLSLKTRPAVVPNGVDSKKFTPQHPTTKQKLEFLHTWLIDDPQGWQPGEKPGSVRYDEQDLRRLLDSEGNLRPVMIWCGRFLKFKRLPLLIEAYANALQQMKTKPVLLLWGGYPGEYEGEHPLKVIEQKGVQDSVFFVGWRGHSDLPMGLNCADVMIAPAVNEPFGMVYIEAMASGTPPIASNSGGPARIITSNGDKANGWTAEPDNVDDLTRTIIEAIENPNELQKRALNGVEHVRQTYDWLKVANQYISAYVEAIEGNKKD